MTDHKPGDVLRLTVPTDGLAPGEYALLSVVDARACVCAAQRFKDGKLRAAGKVWHLNVYVINACFEATGERLADTPRATRESLRWQNAHRN